MENTNVTISYDPEADVMSWEVTDTNARIDHASEMGNLVVHFTENDHPVLIELLNASQSARSNQESMKAVLEKAEA